MLEELCCERVGIDTADIALLHVQIVVVVDWNDTPVAHEDVLSLVHHLCSLSLVCLGLDGSNKSIILCPILDRIDITGALVLFSIDDLLDSCLSCFLILGSTVGKSDRTKSNEYHEDNNCLLHIFSPLIYKACNARLLILFKIGCTAQVQRRRNCPDYTITLPSKRPYVHYHGQ